MIGLLCKDEFTCTLDEGDGAPDLLLIYMFPNDPLEDLRSCLSPGVSNLFFYCLIGSGDFFLSLSS